MSHNVQVYAHRGASVAAPENTLPAFAAALEMGAAGIELDVQCSKDGQLVVIHDFEVDKTTNGHGPVSDLTAAELAALDAGSHFGPEFAGVGVPTLDQVLDLVGDRCVVNIEVKSQDLSGGNQVEPLVELLRACKLGDRVIVSSFNPMTLLKIGRKERSIALGLLYSAKMPLVLRKAWMRLLIRPEAMHPHHEMVDASYMKWARRHGYRVNTWTVNDADEARRLADLGVDTIMTDLPDRIIDALTGRPIIGFHDRCYCAG